jgi:hypothetical protein
VQQVRSARAANIDALTACRSGDKGVCGDFTLTQYLMKASHLNHLGRKTSETFRILQDELTWISISTRPTVICRGRAY